MLCQGYIKNQNCSPVRRKSWMIPGRVRFPTWEREFLQSCIAAGRLGSPLNWCRSHGCRCEEDSTCHHHLSNKHYFWFSAGGSLQYLFSCTSSETQAGYDLSCSSTTKDIVKHGPSWQRGEPRNCVFLHMKNQRLPQEMRPIFKVDTDSVCCQRKALTKIFTLEDTDGKIFAPLVEGITYTLFLKLIGTYELRNRDPIGTQHFMK